MAKPNNLTTVGAISESRPRHTLARLFFSPCRLGKANGETQQPHDCRSDLRIATPAYPSPGFSLAAVSRLQKPMQFHSKNFKILEFCSLILPPSQYSCTIKACTILELKNTLSRFTVKNCEKLIDSRPTQQTFFGYLTMPFPSLSNQW